MRRAAGSLLILIAATFNVAAQSTGRYIVGTREPARIAPLRILRDDSEAQARAVRQFESVDAFAATLTSSEVEELRRSPYVRYVTPVVERHLLDATPHHAAPSATSPFTVAQTIPYGIDQVHARDLWPMTKGKGAVNVAILDTGADLSHPDLTLNIAGGYNTLVPENPPQDDNLHGTHVAGIIAAEDNNIGVVGVAPDARLWIVKVLNASGGGYDETIISGLDWVINQKNKIGGNWIVSMSFGADTPSVPEQEAITRLVTAGILPIAAAGNTGVAKLQYPGGYPNVLSVGAVDSASAVAYFSSGGDTLGVVGPGVDVLSTLPVASVNNASLSFANEGASTASMLVGSKKGEITAQFVKCGQGMPQDFPPGVAGKIALVQRGPITYSFAEKVRAAKAAGAIGVIIYNDDRAPNFPWTLLRSDIASDAAFDWPITVGIPRPDGEALAAVAGSRPITISVWSDDYGKLSGTSMATPYVAGVATLLWSLAPSATSADVRNAITTSAHDLGTAGHDVQYGFGLVDALGAAKLVNPAAFGITSRRRATHH